MWWRTKNEWSAVDKGAGIEVETTDGRSCARSCLTRRACRRIRCREAEVKEKFRSLVEPILPQGRAQQIIAAVDDSKRSRISTSWRGCWWLPPADRVSAVA